LIVKIAPDGAIVKKGEVVVEFDKTRTEQDLAQFRSAMKSARAEIDQSRADGRLKDEANATAVSKARFDLESARLEAGKQEIVAAIEGEKAKLKVADAEQRLAEAEQKQSSEQVAAKAATDSRRQASVKAQSDAQRAERALQHMSLLAPQNGVVSLVQVWRPEGQAAFKPGDRAWPGAPIAELPDLATLRVNARVDETERGRLKIGQPVTVQLEAIPDQQFNGHLELISATASADFTGEFPFPRNFSLQIALDQKDPRLKPGMSGQVSVMVDKVASALTVPAQAVFQKSGRTVVYVLRRSNFEESEIVVGRRSGDRVLVASGIKAGDRVALREPVTKE
jgi:HlyD family secretion protein